MEGVGDELAAPLRVHINDRPPNSYVGRKFHLLYCFVCEQPNQQTWVASGRCHACKWDEREPHR